MKSSMPKFINKINILEALSQTSVRFRVYKRRLTGSSQFLGETSLVNSLIDARGGILTHHTLFFHHSTDSNVSTFNKECFL